MLTTNRSRRADQLLMSRPVDVRSRLLADAVVLALLSVLVAGFARSFFLRPLYGAAPDYAAREPIYYVHGALFVSWFALLAMQAMLVRSGLVRTHRRLGIAGMWLAVFMTLFGVYVAVLAANRPTGFTGITDPPEVFLIVPLGDILLFAVLVALG
jgi:hypothetical protein